MTDADTYRHWAFIGYSHHDARIARRLKARLALEWVPRVCRDEVRGSPSRFADVFLDTR